MVSTHQSRRSSPWHLTLPKSTTTHSQIVSGWRRRASSSSRCTAAVVGQGHAERGEAVHDRAGKRGGSGRSSRAHGWGRGAAGQRAEPPEAGGGDGRGGRLAETVVLSHTSLFFISSLFPRLCVSSLFFLLKTSPCRWYGANTRLYHDE
jgi:hypothetical protein